MFLAQIGVANRRALATLICLVGLVAVSPAGREATQPLLLFIYRSLLLVILALYLTSPQRAALRRVCPYFTAAVLTALGLMTLSLMRWPASMVEGTFALYENLLFAGAFLALAHASPAQPSRWRHVVLASVVVISAAWMAGAMLTGSRPLTGPFVNPNYFASFVLPALAVCAAVAAFGKSLAARLTAAGAGVFLFFGILRTTSRGATLAGAALLGLALIRAARQRSLSWRRIGLGTAAALTAVAIAVTAVNPALVRKFLDLGQRDPYNYQRVEIWRETVLMIGENPVLGVGIGNYFHAAKHYIPPVEGAIARYLKWPNIAHSEYLQYVAEIGIPGSLLLFGLSAYLLGLARKRAESGPAEERWTQEAALLAATGIGLHALVDNNWTVPVLASGLAVIAQADLLPYREGPRWIPWNATVWRRALAILLVAVWVDAAVVTGAGFHFNDVGHAEYVAGDLDRAERNHRFALAFVPRHPVLLDNLGQVYLAQFMETRAPDRLDRAEFAFAEAMRQNPAFDLPPAHMESALVHRLTGDIVRDAPIHLRIIENNRLALAANPFSPFIRKNLAEGLYNLGQKDLASAELLKAIEIEPHYVPGYLRLAEWKAESGKTEEAERYRGKAIAVVRQFQDRRNLDPYEGLILGRPPVKR
jgi:O-antigen ligase